MFAVIQLKLLLLFNLCVLVQPQDDDFLYGYFPDGFIWGCATASYQIEGAWNVDGKGESIWDRWSHESGKIANNDTGDIACDSYNKYEIDADLVSSIGADFYRFSISWSRVMPSGEGDVNQAGIDYYNNLINALLERDVQPMVTLYHWDLPSALQDNYGGWESDALVPIFAEYARLCFENFGDRVKWWITFNEPWVTTALGYDDDGHPPGLDKSGTGGYNAGHVILKSHAEAWHLYNDEFRSIQNGQISITLDTDWKEPFTNTPADVEAAERGIQFRLGWYANPVYINGDYPEIMKAKIEEKSLDQGFNESRLPTFTEEEKQRIVGTWDFFGLNHYTTVLIRDAPNDYEETNWFTDQETREIRNPDWPTSGTDWLRVVPWGFRKLLNYINDNYGNPPIVVTENGMSDRNATLQDDHRIYYYKHYINNMLKATILDGCNVTGYTAWTLMDNFEWNTGYDEKFGMHFVDFEDPDRPRTAKASASYYAQIIADNGFPEPNSTVTL